MYYGILDILAVPFFSILVLLLTRKLDLGLLGLRSRDYDDDHVYSEKHGRHHGAAPMLGPHRRRSSSSRRSRERAGAGVRTMDHNHGAMGTTTPNGGVVDAGNNTSTTAGERIV